MNRKVHELQKNLIAFDLLTVLGKEVRSKFDRGDSILQPFFAKNSVYFEHSKLVTEKQPIFLSNLSN